MKALRYTPEISFGINLEGTTEFYETIFAGTLHTVENCAINYPAYVEGSNLLSGDELKTLTYSAN